MKCINNSCVACKKLQMQLELRINPHMKLNMEINKLNQEKSKTYEKPS
jgi:hypothetical protein